MFSSEIFYTYFAKSYGEYAATRRPYIESVNNFIRQEVDNIKTIVDVGSGDGERGRELARLLTVKDITLIDNSDGMITLSKQIPGAVVIKADFSSSEFKSERNYNAVFCLWNVLGHIAAERREMALRNLSLLVDEGGVIFMDVNNRYNVAHYGLISVMKNIAKDIFSPKSSNGDFNLSLVVDGKDIQTKVHIFSPFEIRRLIKSADLVVVKRRVFDYKTGASKVGVWDGQLVYKLKKK